MTELLELFVLGVWTGIGFLATLLVSRWLRGSGERDARFSAWTVGPVQLEGALVGQHVTIGGSNWTLGQIYVSLWLAIFGFLDIDKERSLLVWPLESGTAFFIQTFGRQPVSDFGSSVWARSW
eukprot:g8156.t1